MHTPDLDYVKPRTLIFDLDGTISDPFEGISKSVNYALESIDVEAVDPERIRSMIGPPLTEIFEYFLGDVSEERMHFLVDKYRERYASIGYRENVIYAQIPEVIEALSSSGYELGICTSKRADYASDIVEMFGLAAHFSFIDGGDVGVHKADQLERLVTNGISADTAAMIGDRHFDIGAAKRNGLTSVGVSWGFGNEEELNTAAPDHLLHSPDELLELFT